MKRTTVGLWAIQRVSRDGDGEHGSWVQVCPERFASRGAAEAYARECEIEDDEMLIVLRVEATYENEDGAPF